MRYHFVAAGFHGACELGFLRCQFEARLWMVDLEIVFAVQTVFSLWSADFIVVDFVSWF